MTRSSLKFLLVGILVGALASGAFTAGAATTPVKKSAKKCSKAAKKNAKKNAKKSTKKCKKRKKRRPPAAAPAPPAGEALNGVFKIAAGTFDGATGPRGSYLRLIMPGGSADRGPFFSNPSSRGGTYTLLAPGADGGLLTGGYQEPPAKPFSLTGDAQANRIITPQRFAGILFSASTSPTDPQTKLAVAKPSIVNSGGALSGQVQALSAQWNGQFFNQGSPKPDGSSPGLTTPVRGTYDAATKNYTLDWSSAIVGGPFNGFTGVWHLEGTFEARCTTG